MPFASCFLLPAAASPLHSAKRSEAAARQRNPRHQQVRCDRTEYATIERDLKLHEGATMGKLQQASEESLSEPHDKDGHL